MKIVGLFDAKTHFSALIDGVERGEPVLITRKGKPVARLVPVEGPERREFGFDDGLGYIAEDFDAPLPAGILKAFNG